MSLEVSELHVGYATAQVLHGVNFSIDSGETVALLGRNGMGKSTLVRAICSLHPPHISAGSVKFRGKDITHKPSFEISRAGIAVVPQGRRVFGSLTTYENLTVVPQRRAEDGQGWSLERVFDFFPRLAERQKSFARSLSGGEQQMLSIARALMTNPDLLIMDEPSEGLAPSILDVIQDRISELRGSGLAVLIAEQNVDFALEMADRVITIDETGTIPWSGKPSDLRADESLLEKYLSI